MATLRESIQAEITSALAHVDALKAQLESKDQGVQSLLLAEMDALHKFYAMFKDKFNP